MTQFFFDAINASIQAGLEICKIYNSNDFDITIKSDNSPLTKADKASNEVIIKVLSNFNIPIISEENKLLEYNQRKNWDKLWLVDPLDGTKEFIKKNGEFTVNIAYIENNSPVFGTIYVPAKKTLYFGDIKNGAYKVENVTTPYSNFDQLKASAKLLPENKTSDTFRIVASKSHFNEDTKKFIDELEKKHEKIELVNAGSSLKLCLVAEGSADIYPRYAPTMEWDIAAGHAIALASGAKVVKATDNTDVVYNKKNLLNPYFVVKR